VGTARGGFRGIVNGLASSVQSVVWLSLIPGWAGFAALEPELGVEHKGGPTGPPYFFVLAAWTLGSSKWIAPLFQL
jgi:hypothetical protein